MNLENEDSTRLFDEESSEEGNEEEPSVYSTKERTIHHRTPTKTVEDIYNHYKRGKLEIRPSFQRGYVWDTKKASRLIESVLLNVPIPMVYTSELRDGTEIVIDGQQRLLSIFSFIDGVFPIGEKPFKLSRLEIRNDLNGKMFRELDENIQNAIYNYNIPFTILTKDSDEEIKFDIFERLNTGSVKLNDQELRNGIYRGNYNSLLKELSDNQDFQFIINNPKLRERM